MAQWTMTDEANGAPIWIPAQFNKTPNTANRDALFGNTTANSFVTGATIGVFGVSAAELGAAGYVTAATVSNTGSGFTARPTVTIGGDGSGAEATAVGVVVNATVNAAGSGYANGDTISLTDGTGTAAVFTVTTGAADDNVASVAISNVGAYTVLPTLTGSTTANTTGSGTGATLELVIGLGPITITNAGIGYTSANATIGGTGGSGASATVSVSQSEGTTVAHAGWNLRRVGSGGRAGRVSYETLVAGGITSDASDDAVLPE